MTSQCNWEPTEFNVLVKPDKTEEKTAGGLFKPENLVEREQGGATTGTLVRLSPAAFSYDEWPEDEPKPQPGAKVVFVRYAGTEIEDGDETFRVMKDKDVLAIRQEA